MNSRVIKLIVVGCMLIDHISMVFLSEYSVLRILRAFPLLCFLMAYGATKTRNTFNYFIRVFIFAIITQVCFNLALNGNIFVFQKLNALFGTSMGLLAICLIKKSKNFVVGLVFVMLIMMIVLVTNVFVPMGYNGAGSMLVILFYLGLRFLPLKTFKIYVLFCLLVYNLINMVFSIWYIEWFSMFNFIILLFFVDKKLKISVYEKWAFYIFYPLHLTILYLI